MGIKKRVISICMAVATVASMIGAGTVTASAASTLYGDVNGDNKIDDMDIARLQQYLSRWNVTINKTNSDVNVDGCIDDMDLARLQQYVSGWNVKLGPKTGKAELRLVNENNQPIAGAAFTIYKDVNNNFCYDCNDLSYCNMEYKGNGLYQSFDLPAGTYFVRETIAPEGYILDNSAYTFVIQKDGEVAKIPNTPYGNYFVNKEVTGSIRITLTDKNNQGTRLDGSEFTIYVDVNRNGKYDTGYDPIFTRITNTYDGTYTVNNLPYGSYFVQQTKAPVGYYLDSSYYSFRIDTDKKVCIVSNTKDGSNLFTNKPNTPLFETSQKWHRQRSSRKTSYNFG